LFCQGWARLGLVVVVCLDKAWQAWHVAVCRVMAHCGMEWQAGYGQAVFGQVRHGMAGIVLSAKEWLAAYSLAFTLAARK